MTEDNMVCESDEGEIISDFEETKETLEDELQNFPHILKLIHRMRERIKRQYKKINKLRNKLSEIKNQQLSDSKKLIDYGTQTDPLQYTKNEEVPRDWDIGGTDNSKSIVEQVKEVAEFAMLQTGFVYEETSGLYYDYNSGYYYDSKQGLYYDGNSGTYYCYDEATRSYRFHSQVQARANDVAVQPQDIEKVKRKAVTADKVLDEIHDLIAGLSNISIERYRSQALDLAKTCPPCMRIIVKETNLPTLKIGSLFLVAYTGGSLGREGDHSVLIPDINISKHHVRFFYDSDTKIYRIVDSGSRNGTILNGKRLSVAKQESEPYDVTHGSIVQVGGTKLLCHIHRGNETCGHCEPGLLQQISNTEENKITKKELHKQELKRLKHKFGVEKDNVTAASQLAVGYQDRAKARRRNVGSLNHHAKTQQSSIDTSITKDNRGFKLLSKMGWSEGQSLGKDGDGRTEPLALSSNHSKSGFGSGDGKFPKVKLDSNVEKKQAVWRKTQKRYEAIFD